MDKIPERIYLQVYGDEHNTELPPYNSDITWCVDQINGNDIEYVLASKYEELEEALTLIAALGNKVDIRIYDYGDINKQLLQCRDVAREALKDNA